MSAPFRSKVKRAVYTHAQELRLFFTQSLEYFLQHLADDFFLR